MKRIKHILPVLLLMLISGTATAQNKLSNMKRYTKVQAGYLMVLRQGDDVFAALEQLATKEKLPSASLSGMGFVNVKFGFFNKSSRQYEPKEFFDMELASMNGSIAWQNGKPSLHLHGVATDKDFHAFGGHMLGATVSTGSLEILVTIHAKKLERKFDEELGANILDLE